MRTRGITWRLMALDLCWFTNASISLSSSCRNLENTQPWAWLSSTGPSATPFPQELPEPRPSEGPHLSDWTDRGTSAFSLEEKGNHGSFS